MQFGNGCCEHVRGHVTPLEVRKICSRDHAFLNFSLFRNREETAFLAFSFYEKFTRSMTRTWNRRLVSYHEVESRNRRKTRIELKGQIPEYGSLFRFVTPGFWPGIKLASQVKGKKTDLTLTWPWIFADNARQRGRKKTFFPLPRRDRLTVKHHCGGARTWIQHGGRDGGHVSAARVWHAAGGHSSGPTLRHHVAHHHHHRGTAPRQRLL